LKLSDSLAQFVSTNPSSFDNPFQEEDKENQSHMAAEFIEREEAYQKEKKKKEKSSSKHRGDDDLRTLFELAHNASRGSSIDDMVDDFEGYIEDYYHIIDT